MGTHQAAQATSYMSEQEEEARGGERRGRGKVNERSCGADAGPRDAGGARIRLWRRRAVPRCKEACLLDRKGFRDRRSRPCKRPPLFSALSQVKQYILYIYYIYNIYNI